MDSLARDGTTMDTCWAWLTFCVIFFVRIFMMASISQFVSFSIFMAADGHNPIVLK
jgi:hypothetical protein